MGKGSSFNCNAGKRLIYYFLTRAICGGPGGTKKGRGKDIWRGRGD